MVEGFGPHPDTGLSTKGLDPAAVHAILTPLQGLLAGGYTGLGLSRVSRAARSSVRYLLVLTDTDGARWTASLGTYSWPPDRTVWTALGTRCVEVLNNAGLLLDPAEPEPEPEPEPTLPAPPAPRPEPEPEPEAELKAEPAPEPAPPAPPAPPRPLDPLTARAVRGMTAQQDREARRLHALRNLQRLARIWLRAEGAQSITITASGAVEIARTTIEVLTP